MRRKSALSAHLIAGLLGLALATDARAAGMSSCDSFKWSVETERAAFADTGIEKVASGAAPGPFAGCAFEVALAPEESLAFVLPPGGKPKAKASETFGAVLAFGAPATPGLYQVTLSGEGWIDVIQDGRHLPAADHTGARECPGLRKSVRFEVAAAPVVLQISGAHAATIKVAVQPAR